MIGGISAKKVDQNNVNFFYVNCKIHKLYIFELLSYQYTYYHILPYAYIHIIIWLIQI